ncbi:DNA polymerase III subunit beta [Campylobacter hyointestinalis]|uniref:Beta sliding clamp n=2 Tax=Campylobacter hyointestinalis TaxID=198 RepID=A0AAV6EFI7_CAMHY|nr:DNA polymerase III subunit beta [Campylobacter hyointestinalis]ANE33402.1 DNA polymerase III, beta subunit [Campylobacter hyointestinalis subsp. lawsonii CCUG 27631]KAB0613706.1 DNA polymerase III subunit beta [Campylobacter hyointestinalis subsp. lawsonii]QKF68623.1 DNA polymerase III, beta subunit [Campylobacter hyointestinalis subsp. lawsonii]RAZ29267.1 DNA polymerase III subunit beta [Campylobacter hyointestinalis subsp. lawsonii]RAZ49099.1 DNA polymerase III subunit beta [Campylobacter
MKVLIKKNVLESIVTNTNPYLEKKDLSSITSHIFISAKDGILSIKATDHEIGLAYKVKNAVINDEGKATANGKKLLDIIKSLKDGDIMLETIQNHLYIKQNNSKYRLPMQKAEDFPSFPNLENKKKFDINAGLLSKSLRKISNSIEAVNSKIELTGALIDVKKEYINLVGTDTKRLSIYKLETNSDNENSNIIIPKKAITEIQKLFFENIEIYYDENILIAVSQNFEFFTKLINGKYPDYNRVVPNETKQNLILNREKMIEGIKTISMLSEYIKITFNAENISFESINEDNSEAKTLIEYKNNISEEIVIGMKNRFMLDFLTSIEDSEFSLGYNDSGLPFILRSGDLKTIIMPVNI